MSFQNVTTHNQFQKDFAALRHVSLNPNRHVAAHAQQHTQWVTEQAIALGHANACSEEDITLLEQLAMSHDIGKSRGHARPEASLALLKEYGVEEGSLWYLVKYHDINLPWYLSAQKGQAPSDKAWRKLARNVDVRLLCLFMVADRVDCPGGWSANPPLVWFLEEATKRGLLPDEWVWDLPPVCALPTSEGPLPKWA